ncbi:MAG: acyltransferase [Ruminiclostridium sp.]|nr:acyltransferase [Ruminiclostridium sp.]
MEQKKRNNLIDALKCLACLAVILLHFPTNEYGDRFVYFQTAIGRCGVPLFFMASGYFFGLKRDEAKSGRYLKNALRMAIYYIVFEVALFMLNALVQVIMGNEPVFSAIDISKRSILEFLIVNEPLYASHLWYILAYMYCLLIYAVIVRYKVAGKIVAVLTPVLLIGYHVLGRYSVIFFDQKLDHTIVRNFLFAAIPMFTVGYYLDKIKAPSKTKGGMIVLIILSFLCLHFESMSFFRSRAIDNGRNNYIFNFIAAFLIIKYITTCGKNVSEDNPLAVIGRKYSLYIYVFQYVASRMLNVIVHYTKDTSLGRHFSNIYSFSKPLMIFGFALIMAVAAYNVEKLITSAIGKLKNNKKA